VKHDVWIAIGVLTVVCFVIKAAGPVALGGRELPGWAEQLIALVPSALLPALVVVETFAHGRELVLDARAAGLAAAIVTLALRGSMLVVLLVAAAVTAGLRALGVG
jgi:branched-subunit amino acid transport protein